MSQLSPFPDGGEGVEADGPIPVRPMADGRSDDEQSSCRQLWITVGRCRIFILDAKSCVCRSRELGGSGGPRHRQLTSGL